MSLSGQNLMIEEGWQQVRAGLTLIIWSRLASWNAQDLALVATNENEFESPVGHEEIHNEFGRLICWIAFGLGSEYLAKGACLLNGHDLSKATSVIRPPLRREGIADWIALVNANDLSIRENDISFGTLGSLPLEQIINGGKERDLVSASIKLLAKTIRNRDAHRYTRNVRAFHFHAVEALFVPAFNILLRSLNQAELGIRLSSLTINGDTDV